MFQFPDLRQVTVLSKAEWQRIQRELDRHNPEKERRTEEAQEREVLHQQSVEVVKQWSNTIAVRGLHFKTTTQSKRHHISEAAHLILKGPAAEKAGGEEDTG